jgi:hypothetical protein
MTQLSDSRHVMLWNAACRLASLAHVLAGQAAHLPVLPTGSGGRALP